ncbi:hypothetical protein DL89DRAFT_265762, partial [Linderina pennispora]
MTDDHMPTATVTVSATEPVLMSQAPSPTMYCIIRFQNKCHMDTSSTSMLAILLRVFVPAGVPAAGVGHIWNRTLHAQGKAIQDHSI